MQVVFNIIFDQCCDNVLDVQTVWEMSDVKLLIHVHVDKEAVKVEL